MLSILTKTLKLGVKNIIKVKGQILMKYFNKLLNSKKQALPKLSLFLFFKHPINVIKT